MTLLTIISITLAYVFIGLFLYGYKFPNVPVGPSAYRTRHQDEEVQGHQFVCIFWIIVYPVYFVCWLLKALWLAPINLGLKMRK